MLVVAVGFSGEGWWQLIRWQRVVVSEAVMGGSWWLDSIMFYNANDA